MCTRHIFFVTSKPMTIFINICQKEYRVRKKPKAYQNYALPFWFSFHVNIMVYRNEKRFLNVFWGMNIGINFESWRKTKMSKLPPKDLEVQPLRNLFCFLIFKIYFIQTETTKGGITIKDRTFLVGHKVPQGYRKYGESWERWALCGEALQGAGDQPATQKAADQGSEDPWASQRSTKGCTQGDEKMEAKGVSYLSKVTQSTIGWVRIWSQSLCSSSLCWISSDKALVNTDYVGHIQEHVAGN